MSEILKSLAIVKKEMPHIKKDKAAKSYKYRGIEDVLNVLGPLLAEQEVIIKREVLSHRVQPAHATKAGTDQTQAVLHCRYTFFSCKDGSDFATESVGEGIDTLDKATAVAISNAFKYAIFEMFTIPTKEQKDSDDMQAERDNRKESLLAEIKVKLDTIMKEKPEVNLSAMLGLPLQIIPSLPEEQLDIILQKLTKGV